MNVITLDGEKSGKMRCQVTGWSLLLAFLLFSWQQAFASPVPFHATYKVKIKGFIMPMGGKGTQELIQLEDGQFLFKSTAKNLFVDVSEESRFVLEQGKIRPLEYQYHRKGAGRNRDAILTFDWEKKRVLNDVQQIPWKMDITPGTLDKLGYQLQIREDLKRAAAAGTPITKLHYVVADGGRLKDYYFQVTAEETLKSSLGQITAVRIERIRHKKKRTTVFWLAPDYDFLLVKFVQVEKKNRRLELFIQKLEFEQPVPQLITPVVEPIVEPIVEPVADTEN